MKFWLIRHKTILRVEVAIPCPEPKIWISRPYQKIDYSNSLLRMIWHLRWQWDQNKSTFWDSATFMLFQNIRGQQFFLTLPKVFDLVCSDVHVAVNCWDCVIVLCTAFVLGPRCCMNFQRAFFSTIHGVLAGKKDQRCLFPALIFFYKPPWNLWFIISVVSAVLCGLGNNQLWIFHAKGNT